MYRNYMRTILGWILLFLSFSWSANDYFGEWVVNRIVTSAISNLSLQEANDYIGRELNYSESVALSGSVSCKTPQFQTEEFSERDLYSYHRVFFNNLNISSVSKVTNIEVFCEGRPWYEFGGFLIYAEPESLFLSFSGYIYELQRKST